VPLCLTIRFARRRRFPSLTLTQLWQKIEAEKKRPEQDEEQEKKAKRAPGAAARSCFLPSGASDDQLQFQRFRYGVRIGRLLGGLFLSFGHGSDYLPTATRDKIIFDPHKIDNFA
jgi:hypothetical protein